MICFMNDVVDKMLAVHSGRNLLVQIGFDDQRASSDHVFQSANPLAEAQMFR